MIQEKRLVRGIGINIDRDYNYAVFTPERDGIFVECTNTPSKKGFVMLREPSNGAAVIPKRLRIAYQIGNAVTVNTIDRAHLKIEAQCESKELPRAYAGFSYRGNTAIVPLDHVIEKGTVNINSALRIYTSDIIPKEWAYRKVRVHTGDCYRIEVEDATNAKSRSKLISDNDLRDEFGARMQWYAGNTMTYYTEIKNKTDYHCITCPKFFRTATNLKAGDMIHWYKVEHDGRIVFIFSPEIIKCDFTKEKINPAKEVPQTVQLCKECNEDKSEVGMLLKEVRDMKKMMTKVTTSYEALQKENKALKKKLKLLASVLGGEEDA